MTNLPTNTPIPIAEDSQLIINHVPKYKKGSNTQFIVDGIGVQPNILVYSYNTTNRGTNTLVASSAQITSQTTNGILSVKRTPVMMAAALQYVNQGNNTFIIGPGTADTPAGYAASLNIQFSASSRSGYSVIQSYPANQITDLLLDPTNTLPTQYYIDVKALSGGLEYMQITSTDVQRDVRIHILASSPSVNGGNPYLLGIIYLDDTTGVVQNQNIETNLGDSSANVWLLPLVAYDPPTNIGSFDIGDPKNDAIVKVEEA